jgi:hypothetical protein
MPVLLAPGLLSLVVSAGLTLSYQAGIRVEARAEQVRPPVAENTTIGVLEVEPLVALAGVSPTLRLEAGYEPRFTRVGGDGPDSDSWLHRARVMARWRPTAAWQFRTNGTVTAGTVDLFRVTRRRGWPASRRRSVRRRRSLRSSTTGGMSWCWRPTVAPAAGSSFIATSPCRARGA